MKPKIKMPGRRIKRAIIILLVFIAVAAASAAGINIYMMVSSSGRIITADEASKLNGVDCILVLGAGINTNDTPTPMLEDRLLEGISLYNLGVSDRLLMSGDNGTVSHNEVKVMKDFALKNGVASAAVFEDHAGFSTYESMYRARDVFMARKVVIVTQKYHMYRAVYIARKLGLDAYGVASDPRIYGGQPPRDIREAAARIKAFFYCVFQPKPTFLGNAIPVYGNGDVTN